MIYARQYRPTLRGFVVGLVLFAGTAVCVLSVTGCQSSPKPARTEVTPGESKIVSEREERRPSRSSIEFKAAPPPPPAPSIHIHISAPQPVPVEPDPPVEDPREKYLSLGAHL